MRMILFVVMLVGLLSFSSVEGHDEVKAKNTQKFKVTYSIVYNAISLTRAAILEDLIKAKHSTACKVDVKVEKIKPMAGIITDDQIITFGDLITIPFSEGSNIITLENLENNDVWNELN